MDPAFSAGDVIAVNSNSGVTAGGRGLTFRLADLVIAAEDPPEPRDLR